jgi:hypothetical protein
MAAAERVFKLLDTPVQIQSPAQPAPFPLSPAALEFDHVWFAYNGEDWVLSDVSFRIEPGETIAVVGHTGAGKTTIASLLLRFYEVQRGVIRIAGIDIRDFDLEDLRRNFGVVLQDPHLFTGTIAENIRLGTAGISDDQLSAAAARVNLLDFVQTLPEGFAEHVRERGALRASTPKPSCAFVRRSNNWWRAALLSSSPIVSLPSSAPTASLSCTKASCAKSVRISSCSPSVAFTGSCTNCSIRIKRSPAATWPKSLSPATKSGIHLSFWYLEPFQMHVASVYTDANSEAWPDTFGPVASLNIE